MAQPAENDVTEDPFAPKVRWVIPQRVVHMSMVGRDVVALAHDVYITFLSLRTGTEQVYEANSHDRGDGVDVIADADVNRYKGLCLMEGEMVAGFSGFPDYLVSVWSWRLNQRLLSLPTGVKRRDQIYMASRTHMMMCQCWGEGLIVWEVAPCYKRCFMLRRAKEERTGWAVSDPPLVGVCWTGEGHLLSIDGAARLYALASDGIAMVAALEWKEAPAGPHRPALVAMGAGVLIYGPDHCVRMLKKVDSPKPESDKWRVTWTMPVEEEVERMVANAEGDRVALWTSGGRVYRISAAQQEVVAAVSTAFTAATVPSVAGRGKRGRGRGRGRQNISSAAKPAQAATATQHTAAPTVAAVDEHLEIHLHFYKQRNIQQVRLIAPAYQHVAAMDATGGLVVYEVLSGSPVSVTYMDGENVSLTTSPADPLLVAMGAERQSRNYGLALLLWEDDKVRRIGTYCLTHQHVSRAAFSPSGRELLVAAMSAGHVFLYRVSSDYRLALVRYTEVGRGLADCCLMRVGDAMRAFCLVLFSDRYRIGERIICFNAATGKDNKFAGKMQGPYMKLIPLSGKDTMLAIPHQQHQYHFLRLVGDKGVTVSVKMGPIIETGHVLRHFNGFRSSEWLLTYGVDGAVMLRPPDGLAEPVLRLQASHRYEAGVHRAAVDGSARVLVTLAESRTLAVTLLRASQPHFEAQPEPPDASMLDRKLHTITIGAPGDKNYLDLQEEKKVREEAQDNRKQREAVVATFKTLRAQLVHLLEENLSERPLHQLSLSEFNLHMENKRERLKAAEREREVIRLSTEARIRAQDRVTAWIKATCWDTMLTPRIKLFAIFSHYQVENYPVLPTQRDRWPELQQTEALRAVEMELGDEFRPWEEDVPLSAAPSKVKNPYTVNQGSVVSVGSAQAVVVEAEEAPEGNPYVLSGSGAHRFVAVPPFAIPQTLAFSFLQMNWSQQITKLNVQNMRLWFNKQFDELMGMKRREVGMVMERNARLRFIIDELNKLSDLRGSFHHLVVAIHDPQWAQEEQPIRLTRVEVEECTIPPWRSHISLPPPELGPKDDFRERALNEMMDGVLEKLWHEEIKKPIPLPQCMLDKEPEHFNEDDLRQVFDYEAKVRFRNEERDKYRKMLHAEYAKLSAVLNEGIVKFNLKVKDMWLTKLRVDSVIGQETLNLMRFRRINLDRVEAAEFLEETRATMVRVEAEVDTMAQQLALIEEQSVEVQANYEALIQRDRQMERGFKNHFADVAPIVFDTILKFFKKRPKWTQRATMIPTVLYELATAVATGVRPQLLHADCVDIFRGIDQLDQISNMPAIMDETMWASMCRLRRVRFELEIKTRGMVQEAANVDAAAATWIKALTARRQFLQASVTLLQHHRDRVLLNAMNRTIQVVLPAGQVEVTTTGHLCDFKNAGLMPRADIDSINDLILRVGALKLRLMRRQIAFRKIILAKEWEHAQLKMKLRHMRQELYSYYRLKIPKELQLYLKNKEEGYTDEMDIGRLEQDMAATRVSIERVLRDSAARAEELEVMAASMQGRAKRLERLVQRLHLQLSEQRVQEDPLHPIRRRREFKRRMEVLVERSQLVRAVQANHSRLALLGTELELLRLRTYPTLASFHTFN